MKHSMIDVDFNKEILFGEIGALISAPSTAFLASLITHNKSFISALAVLGSLAGASLFWLIMRAFDEKKDMIFSIQNMALDIGYFTPAAFLCALFIYYPSLFIMSRHLLTQDYRVISSVIISQAIAFTLFLVAMNTYRHLLWKMTGKEL